MAIITPETIYFFFFLHSLCLFFYCCVVSDSALDLKILKIQALPKIAQRSPNRPAEYTPDPSVPGLTGVLYFNNFSIYLNVIIVTLFNENINEITKRMNTGVDEILEHFPLAHHINSLLCYPPPLNPPI